MKKQIKAQVATYTSKKAEQRFEILLVTLPKAEKLMNQANERMDSKFNKPMREYTASERNSVEFVMAEMLFDSYMNMLDEFNEIRIKFGIDQFQHFRTNK